MRIRTVYFSGTGCTEFVARTVAGEFRARGHETRCDNLKDGGDCDESVDILVVRFAVHAGNAP